jgi:endothelin-converting enzyme
MFPICLRRLTLSVPVGKSIAVNRAELCLTPACVHAASEILYNLSPDYRDLDACDNFEELVCGGKHVYTKCCASYSDPSSGWRDRHDLRADQGDAFTGTIMSEQSQLLLRHILEAPYPQDSQVRAGTDNC